MRKPKNKPIKVVKLIIRSLKMDLHVQVQIRQRDKSLIYKFFIKNVLLKTNKMIIIKMILQIRLKVQIKLLIISKFKMIKG